MRSVAFLLFVSLLAIVFPKGNQGNTQEEFKKRCDKLEKQKQDEKVIKWFDVLDKNKDHYIGKEELSSVFGPVCLEYAFTHYDVDRDGKMNYEEHKGAYIDFDNVCHRLKLC